MYIQPCQNNINMTGKKPPGGISKWKAFKNRVKQKILDTIPEATINSEKKLDKWSKVEDFLSRPAENRLVMGATAILLQPTIDMMNKKVDEDTRKVSRNRTIAKIIAGTLIGIMVRGSCYKLIDKMTNPYGTGKLSKVFLPDNFAELTKKQLGNHKSTISTIVALITMLFTNFAFDAPLTTKLANKFNSKTRFEKPENRFFAEGGINA